MSRNGHLDERGLSIGTNMGAASAIAKVAGCQLHFNTRSATKGYPPHRVTGELRQLGRILGSELFPSPSAVA